LGGEEDKHANARAEEQESSTEPVNQGGSQKSPEEIPDSEDTVDEQLKRVS
jgi:hypothetical protein